MDKIMQASSLLRVSPCYEEALEIWGEILGK